MFLWRGSEKTRLSKSDVLSGTIFTFAYFFVYISGKAFDATISLVVEVGKLL
jgi:hypothetical protein